MARKLHVLQRPKTRADCRDAVRPCPWVSCRHHLFFELTTEGKIRCPWRDDGIDWANEEKATEAFAELLVNYTGPTCVLDVTEQHPDGLQLQEIADRLGVDVTRIERSQQSALEKLKHVQFE